MTTPGPRRLLPVLALGAIVVAGLFAAPMFFRPPPPFSTIDNGPISSGQILNGSVTGADVASWSFYENTANTFSGNMNYAGSDPNFIPYVEIHNPDGTTRVFQQGTHAVWRNNGAALTTNGTYTVRALNHIGAMHLTTTGAFTINLTTSNQPFTVPNGVSGGVMYTSTLYSGSIVGANFSLWTYAAKSGDTISVTVNNPSHAADFQPALAIYSPVGLLLTSGTGTTTVTRSWPVTSTGDFLIQASNHTFDGTTLRTGNYTVVATGSSVLSTLAKADGAWCLQCPGAAGSTGGVSVPLPINVATGNMYESVTDYTTVGTNPLAMIRSYNSMSTTRGLYPTLTGANWRTNYDRYLRVIVAGTKTSAAAERADGRVLNFYCGATNTCTPDTDVDYTLTKAGATWTMTDPNDAVETYTVASGKGTLNSIKLRNGYTQTLNYTAGVLTSVSDSYSRSLGFTYTGGVLTGVTTPDTLTLTYGYTTTAGASLLTSVSYNTSPVTKQTYLYENTGLPFALTGITDENGNRYATWAYDGFGHASSSQLAGGIDLTQISYASTGTNTVTGPLGIVETYKFTPLQGVPKLSEIDRAANGTVTAATRTFAYDTNGYLKTATDWDTNTTSYTNNAHGLPTQIVYASGSTVSHTTTIAYDTTWARLAKTITTPGVTTGIVYDSSGNMLTGTQTDTTVQTIPYSTNGQARTWTFTWSATGQLKTAQLPRTDVTAKTTYAYTSGVLTSVTDALSHVTTKVTYKPGGLALTETDQNSVLTTLAYNPRNWLTSSVLTVAGGTLTTGIKYDSAGNLTKLTLPDSSYLSYGYDNAHRLNLVTNPLSETQNITYNSAGGLTKTLWKNAAAVTKREHDATYDALNRTLTDIGGLSQTTTFGYDSQSNTTSIKDPLLHINTQAYDALNRLKSFTDVATDLSTYAYDAHDRPLTVTDPKSHATTYVYDGFGEAIQATSPDSLITVYYYDKDGNVSHAGRAQSVYYRVQQSQQIC